MIPSDALNDAGPVRSAIARHELAEVNAVVGRILVLLEQPLGESEACHYRGRIDPSRADRPAAHVGRIENGLPDIGNVVIQVHQVELRVEPDNRLYLLLQWTLCAFR